MVRYGVPDESAFSLERGNLMDTKKVISALNKAIALEHTATLQYKQHALLVNGLWRKVFAEFFASQAKSSLEHAAKFGQKIVALGSIPTVEASGTIRQSTEVEEMLRQNLDLEKETMQAYLDAHSSAEGDIALRTMLESHIESEQRDIEELEMYLGMVKTRGAERDATVRRLK
jgi:bacterioferritin